jgi:hypothetical protein
MFACGQHKSITLSNNMVEPSVSFLKRPHSHESFLNQFKYGLANILRMGNTCHNKGVIDDFTKQ